MTATLAPPAPRVPTGDPVQSVTYPISVDYVKSWTLVRALAEAVANAIDADPENFEVYYDAETGELVIEDFAEQGVGVESMVFGWSDKTGRSDVIGQFGEGLKIATIRGVSDPGVSHLVIESVGVTIVPAVAEHVGVSGLDIPVKSGRAPKVLRWDLYPSDRPMGTVVRVGVSAKVAQEVMGRFRHIGDRHYQPPVGTGTVVPDHPGRIWIGGVLVKDVPGLCFGYDLSLSAAKGFQNRDRTVVETHALTWAVAAIQAETSDVDLLAGWTRAALDGTLHDIERQVVRTKPSTADQRRAWADVAVKVLGEPQAHYYRKDSFDTESALALDDDDMTELSANGLDRWGFESLMGLLGVKAASVARREKPEKPVVWAKRLTAAEQANLDASVARLRHIFGPAIIDRVRAYEQVNDYSLSGQCSWMGFYAPRSGDIGVHRPLLADDARTDLDETLFHEAAHRAADKGLVGPRVREHTDRTRGFEDVLGRMATIMLTHLASGRGWDDISPSAPQRPECPTLYQFQMPAGQRVVFRNDLRHPDTESALGPRARVLMVSALLRWAEGRDIPARSLYSTYARENFVTVSRVRQLLLEPIGSQIRYQHFVDVLAPLGIDPAVVWFATTGVKSQWSNRKPTTKNRAFTRQARQDAVVACAALQQGPYAEFTTEMLLIAEGRGRVRPEYDDDRWMQPVDALLARLEADLADPAHDQQAAAMTDLPGGPTIQQAWAARLDAEEEQA